MSSSGVCNDINKRNTCLHDRMKCLSTVAVSSHSVFWDLYCAAPDRRETCEHSSEAKAFHDYVSEHNQSCCKAQVHPTFKYAVGQKEESVLWTCCWFFMCWFTCCRFCFRLNRLWSKCLTQLLFYWKALRRLFFEFSMTVLGSVLKCSSSDMKQKCNAVTLLSAAQKHWPSYSQKLFFSRGERSGYCLATYWFTQGQTPQSSWLITLAY